VKEGTLYHRRKFTEMVFPPQDRFWSTLHELTELAPKLFIKRQYRMPTRGQGLTMVARERCRYAAKAMANRRLITTVVWCNSHGLPVMLMVVDC
jgi:hypothetical protein